MSFWQAARVGKLRRTGNSMSGRPESMGTEGGAPAEREADAPLQRQFPLYGCRRGIQRAANCGTRLHQFLDKRACYVGGDAKRLLYERPLGQHRFGGVQARQVGALEELPNRDFLTPEQRLLHRGQPVRGLVGGVLLKFLHPRTKPLVGIVVVVRHARAEDIQERKALMPDALLDKYGEVLLFPAETPGDKRGPCGQSQ